MANPDHLEILKRSVEEWNQWRKDNLGVKPDLSGAHLEGAHLIGAHLEEADLRWAHLSGSDLSGAHLEGAHLIGAHLEEADLRWANLRGAHLRGAHLEGAHLEGASLSKADLGKANLNGISLRRADLTMADLSGADLSGADLSGADLSGADLSGADLSEANLQNAFLPASRLINAIFDGANLTNACLWETQRAGWSIKGVVCESIYWDANRKKLDTFEPGDFERLYSEKARVQIKYPCGLSTWEIATLPGLIQHLEALHPGAMLRFESIQDAAGGAVVNLVFDDAGYIPPEQIEKLRTTIQSEAEQKALFLRQALEGEKQTALLLKGEVQALERTVDKLLLNQKPTYYLEKGEINVSEFKTDIPGNFQGAIGDNAQAHHLNYTEIGGQIEKSMDLTALVSELEVLRQALKKEATTEEHDSVVADVGKAKKAAEAKDSAKLAEHLKSAGKWAFDVATKFGVSLAAEAIKQSTGMK